MHLSLCVHVLEYRHACIHIFQYLYECAGATKEADDNKTDFRYLKQGKGAAKDTKFIVEHYTGPH